jgi:hypothetical protein
MKDLTRAVTPRDTCPACHSKAVHPVPAHSESDYYRCDVCEHVWNVPKGRERPVHTVAAPKNLTVDVSFRPEDMSVTPIPGGYAVGRILDRTGACGVSWELVLNVAERDEAIDAARMIALAARSTAWIYDANGSYRKIGPSI